jgi:hypothetical protein
VGDVDERAETEAPQDAPVPVADPQDAALTPLALGDRTQAGAEALAFLRGTMHDPGTPLQARMAAAKILMEFTLGRPQPQAALGANEGDEGAWERKVAEAIAQEAGSGPPSSSASS